MLLSVIKNKGLNYIEQQGIRIKKKGDLVLFKYDMVECKFNYEWQKECRGSIVDLNTNEFVCRPFDKFFNFGEKNCDKIDINSMKIREKLDGSLIKLYYYNNEWHISTMSMIDANETNLIDDLSYDFNNNIPKTFEDAFLIAFKNCMGFDFDKVNINLDKNYTYMFELCTPYNIVVVKHTTSKIYFLGKRNNKTGVEELYDDNFNHILPKEFDVDTTMKELKEHISNYCVDEGVVVVDKYYKKAKIKTSTYLALAYFRGNPKNVYLLPYLWEHNDELDEIKQYYPLAVPMVEKIEKIIKYVDTLAQKELLLVKEKMNIMEDRELRKYIGLNLQCQPFLFNYLKFKDDNSIRWIHNSKFNLINNIYTKGKNNEL